MKSVLLLSLILCVPLSARAQTAAPQAAPDEPQRVTLRAVNRHPNDLGAWSFSFREGAFRQNGDLYYGTLYVGEEYDWFQVSLDGKARSAFRDLGAFEWADSFKVPYVEPFPVLKPGEQRTVTVDASGADGEDGAPGAPGKPGADADGVVRAKPAPAAVAPARRPKHDGVPKVDPIFVKAVAGHMYVLHVVDAENDFYVLFRVEALVRGDNCTVSWKRILPPPAESAGNK